MNNDNFKKFTDLLQKNSPSITDGELKISLPSNIEEKEVKQILLDVGYSFDDVKTIRSRYANISLRAESWAGKRLIYNNWEELFAIVNSTSKLPSYFYIVEGNAASVNNTDENEVLKLFCELRKLLAKLADQCDPHQEGCAKGSKRLFYIIETDNSVAKYEFEPTLTWDELKRVPTKNGQLSLVEKLDSRITSGDCQDSERKSAMRSAFHEIISTCSSHLDIFKKTLNSIESFHKRYEEHHDLFVRRFSINKVLHEISEKDLTYTSKINEILSSAQNKALTIPGALIVIGAVMKIDHLVDGLAVAIGMLITTIIVHRSLEVYNSTFVHIEKQANAEFKRYDVLSETVEIRQRAQQTINDLSLLLEKAKKNSKFMNRSIWGICILAFIFIAIVLNRPTINENVAKPQQSVCGIIPESASDVIAPIDIVTPVLPSNVPIAVSSESAQTKSIQGENK